MSVKIIVDSASDIKVTFAQQQNLGFAPLRTILAGTEYRDGIDMSHKMLNDSIRSCGGIDFTKPVVITYAGDLADGTVQKYLEDSKDIYGSHVDQLAIGQLGCVIGTHSGPGAIVVSFVPAE